MTVIAWDGKTLAADRLASGGTRATVTKIFRMADGRLVGAAGSGSIARELIAWARAGEKLDTCPTSADKDEATLLVIGLDGRPRVYYSRPYPMEPRDQHFAIGSGEAYAMAAMHLGHDAVRAVEVACALSDCCGCGIDSMRMEPLKMGGAT